MEKIQNNLINKFMLITGDTVSELVSRARTATGNNQSKLYGKRLLSFSVVTVLLTKTVD